ncbi:MAG: hypothetical protein EAX96_11930 [Candidatus Lokiarchaeota archaeon]|nr:hypothetical protein [Candidatus Lokiarchaeota archaeon]
MSENRKFVVLLEIRGGVGHRLPFSVNSLTDDNIVAIMDELNNVLWLWLGKNTGLVQRRGSMRAARSLKTYGHEYGNSIIGRHLGDILEIKGDVIESDQESANRFQTVLRLFNTASQVQDGTLAIFEGLAESKSNLKYGLTTEQRDQLVKAAIASTSAGDDTRKIEDIVGKFRDAEPIAPGPNGSVAVMPSPKIRLDDSSKIDIQSGIVIGTILSHVNNVFVGFSGTGLSKKFSIEGPEGDICKFTITAGKLNFTPESFTTIDPGLKNQILAEINQRMKLL